MIRAQEANISKGGIPVTPQHTNMNKPRRVVTPTTPASTPRPPRRKLISPEYQELEDVKEALCLLTVSLKRIE